MEIVTDGQYVPQIPLKTDYSSLMNAAFRALKYYWRVLLVMSVLTSVFYYVITIPNLFYFDTGNQGAIINGYNSGLLLLYVFLFIPVFGIIMTFLNYGYTLATMKATRNEKPSVVDLFRPYKKFFTVLFSAILMSIIIGLGFLFLIIPGIYLLIRLLFVPYLVVDCNAGVTEAIEGSWKITRGHFWDIFLVGFVNILLGLVIMALSSIITALVTGSMFRGIWITQITSNVITIPLEMYSYLIVSAMYNAIKPNRGNLDPINPTNSASI
jgi:hypothetical protein